MNTTIFTTEVIALISAFVVLAAAIGFLIAKAMLGKVQAKKEHELDEAQKSIEVLNSKYQALESAQNETQDKLHESQIKQGKLETENESLLEKNASIKADFNSSQEKLSVALDAQHKAENADQAAQAELKEKRNQIQELQERLNTVSDELTSERKKLSEQKERNAALDKQAKASEVKAEETETKFQDMKIQLADLQTKHDDLQKEYATQTEKYTELKTSLSERDKNHQQQLEQFEEQKVALSEQFKVLANDILDAKTKTLQESSKLSLSAVMNPFQQSIDGFKKEVQEIHHRETTQQGELRKELESLKELNQKITTEAHELSTALRGQKKLQGNWGELVLENVLDRSGLQLGKDYKREVSITTEEGRQRPDAIVYLPHDKHLIIDAKVSLNAYTRFVNSEDENERLLAIKEHVHAVGSRIKELADRDYYKLPGLNSPEMVFMFIPIESAFVEALKADENLFQQAIENNVLVATPTTLLTSLNIVRQLWRYEDQNKHTAALANKAEAVFKKLNTFLGSFEKIKKGLDSANTAYTTAENQLVSGKGNLVKQVGEFKNLAPAIKAELPAYFTDKAALEIDFIAAESIEEAKVEENQPNDKQQEDSNIESLSEINTDIEIENN